MDYFDTYSPVVKLASLRTILSVAAINDWEIHQMDVKSAYLYGEFTKGEVIYMREPPGYESGGGMILRLKKPIYGLRQSGLQFHERLSGELHDFEMVKCKEEH